MFFKIKNIILIISHISYIFLYCVHNNNIKHINVYINFILTNYYDNFFFILITYKICKNNKKLLYGLYKLYKLKL